MLKKLRKQKRMSQKDLEQISGVSQSHISRLENKVFVFSPSVTIIIALSKALDVEPLILAEYFIKKELKSNNCAKLK